MKHDVALKVAEGLVGHLRPACTRIEIAGSVRRGKAEFLGFCGLGWIEPRERAAKWKR